MDPQNPNIRLDRAKSLLKRANLLKMTNFKKDAESDYQKCIVLLESLLDAPEQNESARETLVEALIYFSIYLRSDARLSEAQEQLERAKPILASLSDQTDRSFQWSRARYESALGSLLFEVGRVSDAARLRKSAAAAYKSLIFDAGYESETYLYLTELDGYATALAFLGDVETAEQVLDEAVAVADLREQQDNARDNRNMAALMRLGRGRLRLQSNPQDPAGARDLQDALARWDVLIQQFPGYIRYQCQSAQAKLALADSLISNGELDDATTYLSEAYVALKTVVDTYQSFIWKPDLVDALAMKSRLAAAHDNWQRSREYLVSAIELQESIVIINRDSEVQAKRLDQLRQRLSAPDRRGSADSPSADGR